MSRYFMSTMQVSLMGGYFFQIFGEVTGVNILAGNRVIVNFKKDLAARMTGSLVQVRDRRRGPEPSPPCRCPGTACTVSVVHGPNTALRLHCTVTELHTVHTVQCTANAPHCPCTALHMYCTVPAQHSASTALYLYCT